MDHDPKPGDPAAGRPQLELERLRDDIARDRRLLDNILEQSPHGIIVSDATGKLVLQNRAATKIWAGSATAETVDGWGQYRAFHPDGRLYEPTDWSMARCLTLRETVEAEEVAFQRFDGTRGVLLGSCAPLLGSDGELQGAVSVFADISAFKQLEAAVRAREAELTDFLENGAEGLHWVAGDGTILWANSAELELLGYSREEYVGHHIAEFHVDRPTIEDILGRLTCGETLRNYEARLRAKDGSIKHVLIHSNVLRVDSKFVHTRCFSRDVTELRRVEAERSRAGRRLEAEHAVARLLASGTSVTEVMPQVLHALGSRLEWGYGAYWGVDPAANTLRCEFTWTQSQKQDAFAAHARNQSLEHGASWLGGVWAQGQPRWISDVTAEPSFVRAAAATEIGLSCAVAFPVVINDAVAGVIEFLRFETQPPDQDVLAMLGATGAHVGQFVARVRAHERLAEKRRRLELAMDAGRLGPWEWDLRTGVVTWSPAVEAMHGIPTGSFGGTFDEYQRDLHPADRDRVLAQVARTVEEASDHQLDYRIVRPDGAVRWLHARGRFVLDEHGEPLRLIGVCSDVTEEREAQAALQRSEALHAATLMSVGDAVVTTDAAGRVTLLNAVAETLTGWRSDAAVGRPLEEVFQIVNEHTRARVGSPVAQALREQAIVGLANRTLLIRPDGSELAIDDSAAPIRDAKGEVSGVVLVFRDVTDKRRHEIRQQFIGEAIAKLGSTLDYKRTLANVASAAVPRVVDWCAVDVLSSEGSLDRVAVAHVDPAMVSLAEELHRRYPPDVVNGPVAEVLRTGRSALVPEISDEMLVAMTRDADHLAAARQLALRSYLIVPLRLGERTLGTLTFVNSAGSRVIDQQDLQLAEELSHAAATAIENARLYEAERLARADAEEAVRGREDLLAIVSHDLRNPLGTIVTNAWLLERLDDRTDPEGKARKHSAVITRAAERMNRLIADLLDLASLERGQLRVERKPIDAAAILDESVKLFAPLAAQKELTLAVSTPREGLAIEGDAERITQVLSNLIGNAVKFTPLGGRIEVSLAREGHLARFAVADSGVGIPAEQLPYIFDRYWQGASRTRAGVGLGLSIAKGLVEAHGGRISIGSSVGTGTAVEFTLPIR